MAVILATSTRATLANDRVRLRGLIETSRASSRGINTEHMYKHLHRQALRGLQAGALLCLLGACSSPLVPLNVMTPASAYERRVNLAYGEDPRQQMDVYRADKRRPNSSTVVFVYGGAWRDGRKKDYAFMAQSLAAQGHDVLIPDYRLYPQVTWPAFIDDVAQAIRLLDANALEWLGHPLERMVLMGHSSGAHSAAVIAGDPERWLPELNADVVGLIGISGPYDLPLDNREVAPVFEGLANDADAIPVETVDAAHPPTLLMHGTDDTRVLPFHTENMATALAGAAVPHQVEFSDGMGHGMAVAEFAWPFSWFNDGPDIVGKWLDALDNP